MAADHRGYGRQHLCRMAVTAQAGDDAPLPSTMAQTDQPRTRRPSARPGLNLSASPLIRSEPLTLLALSAVPLAVPAQRPPRLGQPGAGRHLPAITLSSLWATVHACSQALHFDGAQPSALPARAGTTVALAGTALCAVRSDCGVWHCRSDGAERGPDRRRPLRLGDVHRPGAGRDVPPPCSLGAQIGDDADRDGRWPRTDWRLTVAFTPSTRSSSPVIAGAIGLSDACSAGCIGDHATQGLLGRARCCTRALGAPRAFMFSGNGRLLGVGDGIGLLTAVRCRCCCRC